ncbi:uncharacterized protein LOC112017216 isoform X2 [Quercus suber]|uniref:uncharacterized protein LOC112017216 isoform X2 n=1 Tax=Quercus suber TaxID=58331 RepID=UPI0032DE315C
MASLTTSGLAIVQHVPELQVDYRNLLKTIYSEPTEAKNKLGCKIWTLFKNCNCATGQELSEQIKDKLGLFCSKFYALEIIASTVLDSTNHSKFGIGGKELNLMVSLTTSEQIKAATNLAQNLDPIQNFLALKLCNKSWTQCWDEGHCNNFFEVSAKCEDDPIFVYYRE